ncbi:ABC transporter permease [Rhizobium sp. RAF56]|uniref:ABC transporter permease n=1 Tax=Rhizobium sp. RAF56 TaxID=3233062 RepID=UPI003F9C6D43
MNTFLTGVNRQTNVILALLVREFRLRNSKHAFHHLFDLLHALFFIVTHWIIFKFAGRHLIIGDSLLTWITTGIAPVLYFRAISIRAAQAIPASKPLRVIPYINPLDVCIAKMGVEVLSFLVIFLFFFVVIYVSGESKDAAPFNYLPILQSISLMTIFAFGAGLVNSFIASVFPLWTIAWSALARVQLFFSAVFFIPEFLPPNFRNLLSYNPMLHFVSLFRTGFYQAYPKDMISWPYMLYWTLGVTFVGLALERVLKETRL